MDNNIKKESSLRTLKLGGYSLVLTVIVIIAAIVVNLIVEALPSEYTQLDLSGADVYRISEDSEKFVDGLDTDITIYYVSTLEGRNKQLNTFVEKYAAMSPHIKIEYVDPELNPKFTNEYGLTEENSLVVASELRTEAINYTDIYEYSEEIMQEYYTQYYTYYMMTQDEQYSIENNYSYDVFDADNEITSAIDYVTTDKLPKVYFLTGHGEEALSSNIAAMLEYNNILLEDLNLLSTDIPEDASMIVLSAPSSDITEAEKTALISYIDNGGKVMAVTDAEDYSKKDMPNLTAVAEHCGMTAHDGIVLENDTKYYSRLQYFLIPRLQPCKITSSIENPTSITTVMNRAHAIVSLEGYNGGMTVSPILLTSETAYVIGVDEEVRDKKDGDVSGQFYLGAISENASSGGTFVWYSSPFIGADASYQFVNYNNLYIYSYSITENCGKAATISVDSVALAETVNLTLTESDITFWTIIVQFVIPLAVLIPGIVFWILRRRR